MSRSLPLTDPLWAELYVGTPNIPETKMSISEWAWMKQLSKIPTRSKLNMNKLNEVKVTFPASNDSFWMKLKFCEGFPQEMPEIECAFQDAFFFDWNPEQSTLKTVISQYADFVKALDDVIFLVKSIADEDDAFSLTKYFIDEEDPDLLVVHLKLQANRESEEIKAKINWRSPSEFPHELRSSNPARFLDLDCEQCWNADRLLFVNFAQICRLNEDSH